jgi:hypothetical protein
MEDSIFRIVPRTPNKSTEHGPSDLKIILHIPETFGGTLKKDVHKTVISARCPKFEEMHSEGWAKGVIHITEDIFGFMDVSLRPFEQ